MMQNRIITLTLVVVLAVAIGVGITVKQANDPVLRRIVQQETQILAIQKTILARLNAGTPAGTPTAQAGSQQLAMLEKKVDAILTVMRAGVAPMPSRPTPSRRMPPPENFTKVYNIPIGHSYVKGNLHAPVTITEFSDFQCPFCAHFHPVLDQVLKAFPGKVKYVIKNFPLPFHPMALPAAKAALAAGDQGKYGPMMETMMKNHNQLSPEKIQEIAKQIGLNMKKFNADLKNNNAKYTKIIQQDIRLGDEVDVRGTPTFYINGRKTMARSLPQYKQEIEKILKKK